METKRWENKIIKKCKTSVKQCFSAGIMQQSILPKCIRQDGHASYAAEVGHPESWEIHNVNRIHGECNNFRFAELRN